MASRQPPPPPQRPPEPDEGSELPQVSTHGELTEKSLKNLINIDSNYEYIGDIDPTGTFGVDPLYGPDTIPARSHVRTDTLGVSRLWRSTNIDDPWGPYRVTWTKVIYGMFLGGVFGYAGAVAKVIGNAALATLGVITIPVKIAEQGEFYPRYRAYWKYTAYRLREKYGFQALWDRLINKADEIKLPKLKSAHRFKNIETRDRIAMWRFAKTVPGFYDYYRPYPVPPPKADFPITFSREEQKQSFYKLAARWRRWYLAHPMKVMADQFRRENGFLLGEPIPLANRAQIFARYVIPKLGRAGFYGLLILRFIAKHGRPNAKRWLYLWTIVGTNIWVAQLLTPNFVAEKVKGPTLMAGALAGWLQYRILIKNLHYAPRIPPRYWPGIVIGWLLCSATLDFAFHAAKKRGEQLDLTSKPMMAMTKNDPTEVIPKETFSGLKKVSEKVANVPAQFRSDAEEAQAELEIIREEMKRDGASNPIPYMLKHIREKYEREHPDHPTKESIQKRSKEWLEEKKREFYAMRELSAEDAAAEAKRKKALEEAKKTITITAANKSQE